jgi:hypothetical protein
MLQLVDAITAVQARIEGQLGELAPAVARLDAIPEFGSVAAQMILAEIELDLTCGSLPHAGRHPTFTVREAEVGRADCRGVLPAQPPKNAGTDVVPPKTPKNCRLRSWSSGNEASTSSSSGEGGAKGASMQVNSYIGSISLSRRCA